MGRPERHEGNRLAIDIEASGVSSRSFLGCSFSKLALILELFMMSSDFNHTEVGDELLKKT